MTAAVIAGQFVRFSSLSDGSLRLVVDVPHEYANDVLTALGFPAGQQVAVALLSSDLVRARSSPAGESQPPTKMPGQAGAKPAASRERREWATLKRVTQAGMRCDEAPFYDFLLDRYPAEMHLAENDPAQAVRFICRVGSRAELDDNDEAGDRWDYIDSSYQKWSGRITEERG